MGFIAPFNDSTWYSVGSATKGANFSLPTRAKAGDILLVAMTAVGSTNNVTMNNGSLTNAWTVIDASTNIDNVLRVSGVPQKGNIWIAWTTLAAADIGGAGWKTDWTVAGGTVSAAVSSGILRPTGNGTLSSTVGGSVISTATVASVTVPQNPVISIRDLRVIVIATINGPTFTGYTWAEVASPDNPGASPKVYQGMANFGGTTDGEVGIHCAMEQSTLDSGAVVVTQAGATSNPTWFVRGFTINEGSGASVANYATLDPTESYTCDSGITATLSDHDLGSPGVSAGRGGGQGISVY